jgi:carboxypeptidase PM20D1
MNFTICRILLICIFILIPLSARQINPRDISRFPSERTNAAIHRFAKSLCFKTTSPSGSNPDLREFHKFNNFLKQQYPETHTRLKKTIIGKASLLYEWKGSKPDLMPVIFCAHIDIVPADNIAGWQYPPFSGTTADGFIHGRGARDFKPGLIGIMEAAEYLCTSGFTPERTVYFAFGGDEETLGLKGAKRIAEYLHSRGITAETVIDEGGGIVRGIIPGIDPERNVALVGIAEQGYCDIELSASGTGGHTASQSKLNPLVILSGAVMRIQNRETGGNIHPIVRRMFGSFAEEASFPMSTIYGNLSLFGSTLRNKFLEGTGTEGFARSTIAFTGFTCLSANNVIPASASVSANLRLLPGTSTADEINNIKKIVDNPEIKISVIRSFDAPHESEPDTYSYRKLSEVIAKTFKNPIVAPSLVTGSTDSRHYSIICKNIYRFAPSISTKTFSGNGHKTDERIPVDNFAMYPPFYTMLIESLSGE